MSEIGSSPLRGRRYTVSLRALMLLIVVAALPLWRVNRAGTQARAVARIKEAGGYVYYDYEFDQADQYKENASPWAPAWLRRAIGDEYFQEVASVLFGVDTTDDQLAVVEDLDRLVKIVLYGKVTDAGLVHLRNLKGLRIAQLECLNITNAGLAHLASLPHLQELSVNAISPGISDAGLAHVARMTGLRTLRVFSSTKITEAGVAQLAKLPHLRTLKLSPVSRTGLARLSCFTNLEELDLSFNNIDDERLSCLKDLTNLRTLLLAYNQVTEAGLGNLALLDRLREVDLSHNSITGTGLRHLRGLHQLRELTIYDTRINAGEAAAFRSAIPGVRVFHTERVFP
jgi:Leucine rich repeat/Leucine Rich repeat